MFLTQLFCSAFLFTAEDNGGSW